MFAIPIYKLGHLGGSGGAQKTIFIITVMNNNIDINIVSVVTKISISNLTCRLSATGRNQGPHYRIVLSLAVTNLPWKLDLTVFTPLLDIFWPQCISIPTLSNSHEFSPFYGVANWHRCDHMTMRSSVTTSTIGAVPNP